MNQIYSIINSQPMKKFQSMRSMSDIKDYLSESARISKTYGKYVASYVSAFTMIMKTCKGRDKICSFIQYSADFYYNCNKYSQIPSVLASFEQGNNHGANMCRKLRNSMKNSRKIFKFLKFIEQIYSIIKSVESKKPIYVKIVSILQHIMACISNFFDNIIWMVNIGVLEYWFSSHYKKFKANKYFFSLLKLIFKMLGNNFQHHTRIKNMKQIVITLRDYKDEGISTQNPTYQLSKSYLKHRRQVRIQALDGAINICRIVMLVRKLKLPGYVYVTKILYSACGLLSTFLSVFKMVVDQPILVQLQQKKDKQMIPASNSVNKFQSLKNAQRIKFSRSGTLNFM